MGEIRIFGSAMGIELVEDRASKVPAAPDRMTKIILGCKQKGCSLGEMGTRCLDSLTFLRLVLHYHQQMKILILLWKLYLLYLMLIRRKDDVTCLEHLRYKSMLHDCIGEFRNSRKSGKSGKRVFAGFLVQEDREGVELVKKWMEEAGMEAFIDPFANLIGVRRGSNPDAPVLMLARMSTHSLMADDSMV